MFVRPECLGVTPYPAKTDWGIPKCWGVNYPPRGQTWINYLPSQTTNQYTTRTPFDVYILPSTICLNIICLNCYVLISLCRTHISVSTR